MGSIEKLADKLKKEFNVAIISSLISVDEGLEVTLLFNENDSIIIKKNLNMYAVEGIKHSAEGFARFNNFVPTNVSLKNISIISQNPYKISMTGVIPLVYFFVARLLSTESDN